MNIRGKNLNLELNLKQFLENYWELTLEKFMKFCWEILCKSNY